MATKKEALAVSEDDQAIIAAIEGSAEYDVEVTDPEEVAKAILSRILDASTEDEVSAVSGGNLHAEEVIGRPFIVNDVHFNRSDYTEGPNVYAVVTAAFTDTGDVESVTCGSRNVMAALLKLRQLGALPTKTPWRIITTDKATASGYYPMWLQKVSD